MYLFNSLICALHPNSSSFLRPRIHCRWHICICVCADTSPWRPCHARRPRVISLVRYVKWAMNSAALSLLFIYLSIHPSHSVTALLCFSLRPWHLFLSLALFVMQEDNSYSPTKSWLQSITGQCSFTLGIYYSEWDSRYSSSWLTMRPNVYGHPHSLIFHNVAVVEHLSLKTSTGTMSFALLLCVFSLHRTVVFTCFGQETCSDVGWIHLSQSQCSSSYSWRMAGQTWLCALGFGNKPWKRHCTL